MSTERDIQHKELQVPITNIKLIPYPFLSSFIIEKRENFAKLANFFSTSLVYSHKLEIKEKVTTILKTL